MIVATINIRIVCAWCKKVKVQEKWITEIPVSPNVEDSHGICPACCASVMQAERILYPNTCLPPEQ